MRLFRTVSTHCSPSSDETQGAAPAGVPPASHNGGGGTPAAAESRGAAPIGAVSRLSLDSGANADCSSAVTTPSQTHQDLHNGHHHHHHHHANSHDSTMGQNQVILRH